MCIMIKQLIDIDGYWEVIVYYNVDYNFFSNIAFELKAIGSPVEKIDNVYYNLKYKAKAVTCSNIKEHISVVLFNYHKSRYDYINSIIHEAEHVKQHMLKAYDVADEGEPSAYTVGYIAMRMLMINTKLKLL